MQLLVRENLRKGPAFINRRNVVLLYGNARPHSARITSEKILDFDCFVRPQPPYSPDPAPSDFDLFHFLQNALMVKRFSQDDQVKSLVENFLSRKLCEFYLKRINLANNWKEMIKINGEYTID